VKKFSVGTDIVETARSIIRTSSESSSVGEGSYCVDVGFMASEGVSALARLDVPDLSGGIASTGDEDVLVRGDGARHDITLVSLVFSVVFGDLSTSFDIPENASHVTRGGDDLLLVKETQQERKPVWALSSRQTRIGSSLLLRL